MIYPLRASFHAAQLVAVAGLFSDWQPVPMRRGADGWECAVECSPGTSLVYKFVVDGEWAVGEGEVENDGMGGTNNVVHVPAQPDSPESLNYATPEPGPVAPPAPVTDPPSANPPAVPAGLLARFVAALRFLRVWFLALWRRS